MEKIFAGLNYEVLNKGVEIEYTGIEYDSRKIKEGNIFIALEGAKSDGHDFIDNTVKLGAKMIIVSKYVELQDKSIAIVKIDNLRQKLGILASNFYSWPQNQLKIVGITGTKGKTTSTYIIETLLGEKVTARIGTIEYKIGNEIIEANNTTPESLDIVKICKKAVDKGMQYLVMEVSSHALEMGRVEMLSFDVAAFTNLTQDHLDYHKTMESYFNAKVKIFDKLKYKGNGVINIDDQWIRKSILNNPGFLKYSLAEGDLTGEIVNVTTNKMEYNLIYKGTKYNLQTELVGKFNLYNILGAVGVALKMGLPVEEIIEKLKMVKKVPGRFEIVDKGQDFMVVVDYAHTDASLENILQALTEIKKKRIITVFGAGGDRDKTKRPKMAKAASKYSDYIILTSDNPRTEDPVTILSEVESGLKEVSFSTEKYKVIKDRETAITAAIESAEKDDIVLIAGKGHETYQIIGDRKLHFDDRETAAKAIENKGKNIIKEETEEFTTPETKREKFICG